MDLSYAVKYRDLYENHWWWRSREQEIVSKLRENLSGNENRILDVGCGDGLFFDRLIEFGEVVGIESDPATLSGGRWNDQIICQSFGPEFQPDCRFDAILMLDILEHMPDPESALAHAKSLLTENGILIATVPAFMSLWTSHDELNHHVVRYTRRTFFPLFTKIGLDISESKYLFHWTCPAKLLIKAKEFLLGSEPKTPTVPSSLWNHFFLGLTRLEQATISRWNMPFGSSLMAIAKK
ncbi:MAG: class I SAM-dependent methyltransferase [Planctomycetota bacterium]